MPVSNCNNDGRIVSIVIILFTVFYQFPLVLFVVCFPINLFFIVHLTYV
jgi:hypothetical protein